MVYKTLLPICNVSVKVDAQMHSPVELNGCGGNTVPKYFLNWWVDWEKKRKENTNYTRLYNSRMPINLQIIAEGAA